MEHLEVGTDRSNLQDLKKKYESGLLKGIHMGSRSKKGMPGSPKPMTVADRWWDVVLIDDGVMGPCTSALDLDFLSKM